MSNELTEWTAAEMEREFNNLVPKLAPIALITSTCEQMRRISTGEALRRFGPAEHARAIAALAQVAHDGVNEIFTSAMRTLIELEPDAGEPHAEPGQAVATNTASVNAVPATGTVE